MEIELEKTRNDLLNRTNIFAKIRAAKTPSRKELLSKVAAMLGVDEKLIVVDKIVPSFGEKIISSYIKCYDDLKSLKEIELEYKIKRTGNIEEKIESKPEDVKNTKDDDSNKEDVKDTKE
jgi:ribosomal protein S24E